MSTAESHAHDHDHDHGHHHHHDHDHHLDPVTGRVVCCELHNTHAEGVIVYALVGGVLVLTTVLAQFLGMDPQISEIPAVIGALLLWIPLLKAAYREIKNGRPSSSFLVALAISAALAVGEYVTAGGLAFILFLMDAVLERTAWGAHKAIEQLVNLTPDRARVVIDGEEREVDLAEVKVGSIVRVRAGENLPCDGRIISGRSSLNQASLTGESAPIEVETGDVCYAGTSNLTGVLDVEVTRVGAETTIGKVVNLINEAESSKTPRQQIIEIVASHYVWIVFMIAIAVWILSSPAEAGGLTPIEKAISVLVVTCPGALLLASPTAMVASFASAARLGVLMKSTETLEAAGSIDTVVLDKTGTLTTGRFAVSRLAPREGVEGATLLAAAATAEQHSNHPLALAIMETARAARVDITETDDAEEVHGLGVRVPGERDLYAGRAKWLLNLNPHIADQVAAVEDRIEGMTGVHVMERGQYLGAVGLEDRVRRKAEAAVNELREVGVKQVQMFTGDRHEVAARVAAAVGIEQIEAECHPEEKHAKIVALTERGRRVMMVGDGINDGPSLAAADVGVAMGLGGTDIAANSAGIALMNDDLTRLPFTLQLARKTRVVIAQNIAAALLIAVVGLVLAATGRLGENSIFIAAVYHSISDIFVIANSFRLVRFGEEYAEPAHAMGEAGSLPTIGGTPQPA